MIFGELTSDWLVVQNKFLYIDLEATPLQVKTDSIAGSKELIKIWMWNKEDSSFAAGIRVWFTDPIKYSVVGCSTKYTEFTKQPPSEQNKIWTFSKTELGMKVEVNGVEVLDYHYSESLCGASWKRLKELNIHHLKFDGVQSKAADFYRPKQGEFFKFSNSLPILLSETSKIPLK